MQDKNSQNAKIDSPEDVLLRSILKRELERREMKQNQFAELLGCTPAYLNEILHGGKSGQRYALRFLVKLGLVDLLTENQIGVNEGMAELPWEYKKLYEGLERQVETLAKSVEKLMQEHDSIWQCINQSRDQITTVGNGITNVSNRLADAENKMDHAADSNNLSLLKKEAS